MKERWIVTTNGGGCIVGLDNGLIIKGIKKNDIPPWVILPWDWNDKREEQELLYFRKCWGIRGEILAKLHCIEPNDSETNVDVEDILPLAKILMKYLDKEYYDDNANSIWEYDEYIDNIQQSIVNLVWLKGYMEAHPKVECYFYDSW